MLVKQQLSIRSTNERTMNPVTQTLEGLQQADLVDTSCTNSKTEASRPA
jgi:hypothetical protein